MAPYRLFKRVYGASPAHLLALLASFALTGYIVRKASLGPLPERMGVWFVASFIGHDFVLYPLYTAVDRLGLLANRRLPRRPTMVGGPAARRARSIRRAAQINAVRVPALFSVLLLVVFQGPIRHQGDVFFYNASGLHETDYFGRWLLTSAVLFILSLVWLGLTLRRHPSPDKAVTRDDAHAGA